MDTFFSDKFISQHIFKEVIIKINELSHSDLIYVSYQRGKSLLNQTKEAD